LDITVDAASSGESTRLSVGLDAADNPAPLVSVVIAESVMRNKASENVFVHF
jgi:hypothetical protein